MAHADPQLRMQNLAFRQFVEDILEPAIAEIPESSVVLRPFRAAKLAEILDSIRTATAVGFFAREDVEEWAQNRSPIPASFGNDARLQWVEYLPSTTPLNPGWIRQEATTTWIIGDRAPSDAARFGSALYSSFVHGADPAAEEFIARATFSSDEEWHVVTARLAKAAGDERLDRRVRLMASLPSWITDGPTSWRETVRFVGEDLLGIPPDAFDIAGEALVNLVFSGEDFEALAALGAIFSGLPPHERLRRSAAYLVLDGIDSARHPVLSDPEHEAPSRQILAKASSVHSYGSVSSESSGWTLAREFLVNGMAWRVCPPHNAPIRRRVRNIDEIMRTARAAVDDESGEVLDPPFRPNH